MDGFTPHAKLWVERDGQIVMSDYRVRLLQLIHETRSLAAAANTMELSYRRAWGKVKELEENLGQPLVESEVGGAGGGSTTLTPKGREIVEAYEAFQQRLRTAVDEAYAAELGPALQALEGA